jgi:hypothetical protein
VNQRYIKGWFIERSYSGDSDKPLGFRDNFGKLRPQYCAAVYILDKPALDELNMT